MNSQNFNDVISLEEQIHGWNLLLAVSNWRMVLGPMLTGTFFLKFSYRNSFQEIVVNCGYSLCNINVVLFKNFILHHLTLTNRYPFFGCIRLWNLFLSLTGSLFIRFRRDKNFSWVIWKNWKKSLLHPAQGHETICGTCQNFSCLCCVPKIFAFSFSLSLSPLLWKLHYQQFLIHIHFLSAPLSSVHWLTS